ncbi:MAG: HAMP domain-containing histidine kinase [Deltaproteobacteria bacterium]|nr:HAMP domain-containing histidine kinase [Deltaproteobacteria bacterium]MBW2259400.1 HAMP domain-containing histidine kinase [Deltaproteobacteria bacterium]
MSKTNADQVQEKAMATGKATDVDDSLDLRRAQLEVLSKVLGDVTHDVQNHLAIINESAGWMGDLLNLKKKKGFGRIVELFRRNRGQHLDVEPFFEGLKSIHKRVGEAATLTRRLSRFGDRMNEAKAVIDANQALEEIRDALLGQATERGVRLEVKLAKEAAMVETEPAAFQLSMFGNVAQLIEGQEKGASLAVGTNVNEDRFHLHVTGPEGSPGSLPDDPVADGFSLEILEKLGGEIWSESHDGKYVTTLAFPLAGRET